MFRTVEFDKDIPGRLFLHSMPGRSELWDSFSKQVKKAEIDLIVSLTALDEIRISSPEYACAIENDNVPCSWMEYPIEDFSVPADRNGFAGFVSSIANHLKRGDRILIHCAGGIGRTGTVATCILQQLGEESDKAGELIRKAGSGPETPEQAHLILWHSRMVILS